MYFFKYFPMLNKIYKICISKVSLYATPPAYVKYRCNYFTGYYKAKHEYDTHKNVAVYCERKIILKSV